MAKNFITGSARSPSNEEFRRRIEKLTEMPSYAGLPANKHKQKSWKKPFAWQPRERPLDGTG
ncbi:hypothetical protein [Methylobacterium sp. 174MFSha1.1]|uniref:hypothetical protein n=1 Tax=Methylobacterium sp. 174MFSha1.1 TaxID=1502749 RepID=UPI001160177C|nr:hypothetical protein [Methylobacterium sp. 174MFSha1.1]